MTLTGENGDDRRSFSFATTLADRSQDESHGFVEKLWALRRIGEIIDELDLNGTNQELIDELVRLSIAHGVMTPYTSFLADEDVNLAARDNLSRARVTATRELAQASGRAGFAQRRIKGRLQQATSLPAGGGGIRFGGGGLANGGSPAAGDQAFVGGSLVAARPTVRNIGQKSFFLKGRLWRDSTVTAEQEKRAIRVTQYSKQYFDLAAAHRGALAKYLAFNGPVLVNLNGKTYRIEPPAGK